MVPEPVGSVTAVKASVAAIRSGMTNIGLGRAMASSSLGKGLCSRIVRRRSSSARISAIVGSNTATK